MDNLKQPISTSKKTEHNFTNQVQVAEVTPSKKPKILGIEKFMKLVPF